MESKSSTWPTRIAWRGPQEGLAFDSEWRRVEDPPAELPEGTFLWTIELEPKRRHRLEVESEKASIPLQGDLAKGDLPGLHVVEVKGVPDLDNCHSLGYWLSTAGLKRSLELSAGEEPGRFVLEIPAGPAPRALGLLWNGRGLEGVCPISRVRLAIEPLSQAYARKSDRTVELAPVTILKEHREAFFAAPGESLHWRTSFAAEGEIHVGLGVFFEQHEEWGKNPLDVSVIAHTKNGEQALFERRLSLANTLADHGWQDFQIPWPFVGEEVDLEFRCEGGDEERKEVVAWSEPVWMPNPGDAGSRPLSVILISADTFRADRLGKVRNGKSLTPNLDALVERSVTFTTALSASSYTLPSHATMLSGQHPLYHGVNMNPETVASSRTTFLAETLREEGYVTAGYTGGGFVSEVFGFGRGFDRYSQYDLLITEGDNRWRTSPRRHDEDFNRGWRDHQSLNRVEAFLRQHRERPFFLFFHTFLVHSFAPTEEALAQVAPEMDVEAILHRNVRTPEHRSATDQDREREVRELSALYDATVWMLDRELGSLFRVLEEEGLDDRTIIVFTSDHGEEFGEHDGLGHGRTLYEESVRIPLVFHYPGCPSMRLEAPVWNFDIVPTLLDLLGLNEPATEMQGDSLLPLTRGEPAEERTVVLENKCRLTWERYALRTSREKVIWNVGPHREGKPLPEYESFDIVQDPGEQDGESLDASHRKVRALKAAIELMRVEREQDGAPLGSELLDELRELGYLVDG